MTDTTPSLRELVRLTRRFSVLLGAGADISATVRALTAEASPAFHPLLEHIDDTVRRGGRLTEALAAFPELSPALYREWVSMGETMGVLGDGAREIAELLEPLAEGGGDLQLGWARIEQAVPLIQFTRRCAELLELGLEWWRVMFLLIHEAPPDFADGIRELTLKRDDARGLAPLWERMDTQPERFSACYRAVVRLGWEARTMDEAMRLLADLLLEDWTLCRRTRCFPERAAVLIDHGAPPVATWADLTPLQQRVVTILFCRTASRLLSLGVGEAETLATCALLLPRCQQEHLAAQAEELPLPETLAGLGCFSPFLLTLLAGGAARGRLDYAFHQGADVLRAEIAG